MIRRTRSSTAARSAPIARRCASAGRKCSECWEHESPDARPADDVAGISIPWIGADYECDRVAVAGINLYDYGGLFAQWLIYHELEEKLARAKRYKGSMLPFGVGAYVSALLHKGSPNSFVEPSSLEAAKAWRRISFLELVKCSPRRDRSAPNREMWANCLGEFLLDELRILRPKSLIVIGGGLPALRVQLLPGISGWRKEHGLQRGVLDLGQFSIDVYCCFHTAYRPWRSSIAPLLAARHGG